MVSDFGNEMDTFRHAYMVLKNYRVENEDIDRMKTLRALFVEEDGDIKYLTKDIPTEALNFVISLLKKQIERFSGNLDFSDPEVYGRATNLAISTRIKPLHNRAKTMTLELVVALNELFECVFNIWNSVGVTMDWTKLDYEFNFDTPINNVEEADTLLKLKQVGFSDEDLFRLASFIDEPEQALKRAEAQMEKQFNEFKMDQESVDMMSEEE